MAFTLARATRFSFRGLGPAQISTFAGIALPGRSTFPVSVTTRPLRLAVSVTRTGRGTTARASTVPASFGLEVPGTYGVNVPLQRCAARRAGFVMTFRTSKIVVSSSNFCGVSAAAARQNLMWAETPASVVTSST